jgi:hypothetical protein
MCQEKSYKVCFNVRSNGTTYKEFKLKNTNELFYSVFANQPLHFKGHNLLISSLISTFFVLLDAPSGELQNILEA